MGLCGLLARRLPVTSARRCRSSRAIPRPGVSYEATDRDRDRRDQSVLPSLSGGTRGASLSRCLGTPLTIGYLEKILSINAVGEPMRLILTGAIIVAAVLLQLKRDRENGLILIKSGKCK